MIVDRLLFLWVEKGTQCAADDDIQCGATESDRKRTDKRRSHYSPILRMSF